MKAGRQTTLRRQTAVSGIGVHSGSPATLTMLPAEADTGILFIRCGTDGKPDREIVANVRAVTATEFATVLGDATGPLCSTAEHVLAALSGLGVDNAVIEIDGPEVPIMDGSAAPFVEAIDRAGLITLAMPRRYIRILKPVRVANGDSYGELRPHPTGFRVELHVDAWDRHRLLEDLSRAFSESGANIVEARCLSAPPMVKNRFVVEVADTHSLKGAITRLRNIESVFDAYRVTPGAAV